MKRNIITITNRVSCLPGYENFDTVDIAKRMPRRQYLKSIKELRFEKEHKEKILYISGT